MKITLSRTEIESVLQLWASQHMPLQDAPCYEIALECEYGDTDTLTATITSVQIKPFFGSEDAEQWKNVLLSAGKSVSYRVKGDAP